MKAGTRCQLWTTSHYVKKHKLRNAQDVKVTRHANIATQQLSRDVFDGKKRGEMKEV